MSAIDPVGIGDVMHQASGFQRPTVDRVGIRGHGEAVLTGPDGRVLQVSKVENTITTVGDQFYADRAAMILGTTKSTTGNTNADPSVVTTGTAHGFGVGDKVIIAGHNPAALNGSWVITAVGSTTTFTVDVGAAPGAFVSNGTAQSLTMPPVSGMRLGTGTGGNNKTGAGSFIGTYKTGSQHTLAATYPLSASQGTGRRITYQVVWAAGEATEITTPLAEVVLTIEWPLTDTIGTAANTIARALLSPTVLKGASDTLTVTWNHDVDVA